MDLLGPLTTSPRWQAHAGQGFDHPGLTIDWQAKQATCPQGKLSRKWTLKQDRTVSGVIRIQFGKQECLACPLPQPMYYRQYQSASTGGASPSTI